MAILPTEWHTWVLQNILGGRDNLSIANELLTKGFTLNQIKTSMGNYYPPNLVCPRDEDFYKQLANPNPLKQLNKKDAEYNVMYLESEKAQVFTIDDFLDVETCQNIIALIKNHLHPSEMTGNNVKKNHRTSTTCHLSYLTEEIASDVDAKIINMMGFGFGETEGIQAQHYAVGQEFKEHTDYFEPAAQEYQEYANVLGQRTWTVMVYLNDVEQGGETEFLELGLKFTPKRGMAVVWNNLNIDGTPNPSTIHQAHPIIAGEKTIITKWFRDRNED